MVLDIDQIFEMLSWNNDNEMQIKGIEEAKKVKHLSVFLQPIESKSVWENCAKVLISKSDEELALYLVSMFMWLQDMNWPGAYLIYDRLKIMPKEFTDMAYKISLSAAVETGDTMWEYALRDFENDIRDQCERK